MSRVVVFEGAALEFGTPEFSAAIKAGLPVSPPRYRAGDWVWDHFIEGNVRVSFVTWDRGYSSPSFWRVSVPGHSADEFNFSAPHIGGRTLYTTRVSAHCARLDEGAPLTGADVAAYSEVPALVASSVRRWA